VTEFERQTIEVAQWQFWATVGADVIATLALVAAVVGGVLAYKNIRLIVDQLELSRWSTLLVFEQDMAARRAAFHVIDVDMKAHPEKPKEEFLDRFNDAKENYFNSLDRLASSILRGHFPADEMKQDYREVITDVVRAFPDDFPTGTRYRKVVKLFNLWEDQT
jgi:hypothetical protein